MILYAMDHWGVVTESTLLLYTWMMAMHHQARAPSSSLRYLNCLMVLCYLQYQAAAVNCTFIYARHAYSPAPICIRLTAASDGGLICLIDYYKLTIARVHNYTARLADATIHC